MGTMPASKKIMLVGRTDSRHAKRLKDMIAACGHQPVVVEKGVDACEAVRKQTYDLVITDLNPVAMSGMRVLSQMKEFHPPTPVIVISDQADVGQAVEAMKRGAHDFLLKPLRMETIQTIIALICGENRKNGGQAASKPHAIITRNAEMKALLRLAGDIADSRAAVFIQGESGTGKELFARYIHRHSAGRSNAFVAINCSALPDNLLESELFGHEKGAFTGALKLKRGKFELADGGTLLLDEISEMDASLQAKLLRVLQEKEVDRIGGTAPVPIDVRIIATTNREIEKEMQAGRFREDLFYRLNVVPIHLPPLRGRKEDIPLLAAHFIEKYNRLDGKRVKGLTNDALHTLLQHTWPGNVREFENVIERAVLLCRDEQIDEPHLFMPSRTAASEEAAYAVDMPMPLKEMEKKMILGTLRHTNGNRTHAAEMLGISVRTLRNKLSEYKTSCPADS